MENKKIGENSFLIIILIFMILSMFPPWSLIGVPLQSVFGVLPAQEEEKLRNEIEKERELAILNPDLYYDKEQDAHLPYKAYTKKDNYPFRFLSLLGGPITVAFVGYIFYMINRFLKRNNKKEELKKNPNDNNDLNKEDIPVTRIDIIKSQILLLIEIGVTFFITWIIISTRNVCNGVGEFCGIGTSFMLMLIAPIFFIFVFSCRSYSSAKIKKLKLHNLEVSIWFKFLDIFSRLILLLLALAVLLLIFGPYILSLLRT